MTNLKIKKTSHLPKTVVLSTDGLTLVEVIIVIALLIGSMVYLLPNLTFNDNTTSSINLIKSEIKNVFDTTVLSGVPHRMCFYINQRKIEIHKIVDYSPEVGFFIRDSEEQLTIEQENLQYQEKVQELEEITSFKGKGEVADVEKDRILPPTSPLLNAKSFLLTPRWTEVNEFGHKVIYYNQNLVITKYYVEHLEQELVFDRNNDNQLFYLYFFPRGYVQKAYIVFNELNDNFEPIEELPPFIIKTNSYQGTSILSSNIEDATIDDQEFIKIDRIQ